MTPDEAYEHVEHARMIANMVRIGTVAAVDAAAGTARVDLGDGWTSDDLAWIEARSGAMRTWSAPTVGEQVIVLSASGETGAGVILRGLSSRANPAAGADANFSVLGLWADQARDAYDAGAHARTLDLPAGGSLVVTIGGVPVLTLMQDRAGIAIGSAQLVITDGRIQLLAGEVDLGSAGAAVARVGDAIDTTRKVIIAGSGKVKAG